MLGVELEFVIDTGVRLLVEDRVRQAAGEALARLTVAQVSDAEAPAVMRAVMNALDEKG